MSSPKISILIPVYKVEKYIEKCIFSLLDQTINEQIEIIFVNDYTPDKSIDILNSILRKNPPKSNITIQILHHKENRGQAVARLTALNHAKGTYIIYIDSDDYIDLDMLEKMYIKALETDSDIVMVDVYKEFNNCRLLVKSPYNPDKKEILSEFIRGTSIYLCNKLIKRELFLKFSSCFKEGYNMSEDYTIMTPLSFAANRIEYVPNTYYHYIQYNTEATTKRKITQHEIDSWLYSIESVESFLKNNKVLGYEKDVIYRKIIVKYWCMLHTSGEEQRKYSKLYPEIKAYSLNTLENINGVFSKIFFFLIINGNTKTFNLYLKLKKNRIIK